jgi:small subunit ribosomal protein S20
VAHHKSAKKRARQTIKRTERNRGIRTGIKTAVRAFRETLEQGDAATASDKLKTATRSLSKARAKGVLHPRTISRRISRLAIALQQKTTGVTQQA